MQRKDILTNMTETLSSALEITQQAASSTASTLLAVAMQTASQLDKITLQPSGTAAAPVATPAVAREEPLPNDNKKKSRPFTTHKANVTASLSLEGERKKTLNTLSTMQYVLSVLSRSKPAKYVDDGIDICSEMAKLQSDLNKEEELTKKEKAKENTDETAQPRKQAKKKAGNEDIIEALQVRKIELVKDQIIEHAARRADLFFYLLVAVYGEKVTLEENGGADKQHGRGSQERGTAACHSFPFSNFKVLTKTGNPFFIPQTLQHSDLLDNTYLIEALNSTVELPELSNCFDGHLEGRFQRTSFIKDCMQILNKAANSEIDPAQGMNEFYNVMDDFFSYFHRSHLVTNKKTIESFKAYKLVWEYQKEGTFSGRDENTHKINKAYLNMMLRINSYTNVMPYSFYYKKIQNELLQSKMGAKPADPAP